MVNRVFTDKKKRLLSGAVFFIAFQSGERTLRRLIDLSRFTYSASNTGLRIGHKTKG